MMIVKEILEVLNTVDENSRLEAKKGTQIDKSILETVCAFSNEPKLGGGIIVLGVERDAQSLFPSYVITGVENSDKIQSDLASQCASVFNRPVRPDIEVEHISDKTVIKIHIPELPKSQKPLYFTNKGIPEGIYRRSGSTDQSCTEDDLPLFYNQGQPNFDASILPDSSLEDISDTAIDLYRKFIIRSRPNAEELEFSDIDLLYALNAIKKEHNSWKLTYTGALVFGSKMALRRLLPMCRVDYIRIAGKEWVENPDVRFESTIDFRGSLLELLPRVISTIADDLPKGFYLPEGQIQADTKIGLPYRVLREAVVNAFIHRSYRVNSPIQIIRYSNRIEIKNAGCSLKSIDTLGESGSVIRNPNIASIFHDANIAETKGTGIKIMKKLLVKNQMMMPTYESNRANNEFTLRLLIHHFLGEKDLVWLANFTENNLSDYQKTALVFVREVGAIDNQSYRQLTGCNSTVSTTDLRQLCSLNILRPKGKTKATYYIVTDDYYDLFYEGNPLPTHLDPLSGDPDANQVTSSSNQVTSSSNQVTSSSNQVTSSSKSSDLDANLVTSGFKSSDLNMISWLTNEPYNLPDDLVKEVQNLGKRVKSELLQKLILELCSYYTFNIQELVKVLNRTENHLKDNYLSPLLTEGKLEFTIPEIVNHPKQAYRTVLPHSKSVNNEI